MNKLLSILLIISSYSFSQGFDFQQLCLQCAEQNGFYCGDDQSNWTQYSPNGCVPNGQGGLEYLNDGWDDCVDGSDEDNAVPTSPLDCLPPIFEECDTVYEIEYETIYDTIVETEFVYETVVETVEVEVYVPQYIYVTDTVYADVLDTMYIDVIEYVEVIVEEYIDCVTGLPCNSSISEIIEKSKNSNLIYNLQGQVIRKPEDIYIEGGKVKYKIY